MGPEADVARGVLPDAGAVVTSGHDLVARLPEPPPLDALEALPGLQVVSQPCARPPRRLALVAREASTDLAVAVGALDRWRGAVARRLVGAGGTPTVQIALDGPAVVGLGLTPEAVGASLADTPSAGGEAVLAWPDVADVDAMLGIPVVGADGTVVPLAAVARLSLVPSAGARFQVDGRRALLLDVWLAEDVTLGDWDPPPDVEALPMDGLGPDPLRLGP